MQFFAHTNSIPKYQLFISAILLKGSAPSPFTTTTTASFTPSQFTVDQNPNKNCNLGKIREITPN